MANKLQDSVRQVRLHEQVADRIRQLILDRELGPGDALPSERQLAVTLNVSRVVIREAMRVLVTQGFVEIKHGSGAYVKHMRPEEVLEPWTLFLKLHYKVDTYKKVAELRRTLEIEIAGLAAERATAEDMAQMEACIENMVATDDDDAAYSRHDLAFHTTLADATHNELYALVLRPLTDLLLEFRHEAHVYHKLRGTRRAVMNHREILAAVRAGDAAAAQAAMAKDLTHAEEILAFLSQQ